MNTTEKISKEVKGFHEDIEKWFHGQEKDQDSLYEKLLSGFAPDFTMVNGNDDIISLSAFAEWLPGVYGKFPERRIILENIEITHTESHGLASYIEIQITGDATTRRQSSAVFLVNEEKAVWLHLIEHWI
ncbi:hypothetical protein [Chryseobacterium sp. SIMBA_029]|uniref:hypothetical protein n=1 Tax=Chryseobacterium sp. SIMBA_029 TaxID=3085772 RepID=UPI0039793389